MKSMLLIIPALMVTALFAQAQGFNGRRGPGGNTATTTTAPTPEQAATREVNLISSALRLGAADTTAMLAALACATCALTTEQTTLQTNAVTLKTDWTTLTTDLTTKASTTATVNAINALQLSNLEARVTAAGAVLAELTTLKVTLTSAQETELIQLLVGGGGRRSFRQ
jgi:hypothetical protein